MNKRVEFAKVVQIAGLFGAMVTLLVAERWRGQNPDLIRFDTLIIGFLVAAVVGSVSLAFLGERKRAWQRPILIIIFLLLIEILTGPMVIR